MPKLLRLKQISSFLTLLALMLAPGVPVLAAGSTDIAQPVTQSYGTDGTLQQGMIVRLDDNAPTKVDALEAAKANEMHGVVVAANDAALTLSSDAASRQVYVATYGRNQVLVSDQNGVIKKGDFISISSLNGIGMKADARQPIVLGKATEGFSGTSNVVGTASLRDATGKNVDVSLGRVMVDMTISHNPLQVQAQASGVTGYLQSVSTGVAGKTVSAARLYLSIVILFLTAVVSGSILYSGVRSSVLSIGRNPLAKQSIMRSLFQVVTTSVMIFIIGLLGVYLLLKL